MNNGQGKLLTIQVAQASKRFPNHSVISMSSVASLKQFLVVLLLLGLSACSFVSEKDSAPGRARVDAAKVPDAVPRVEPRSELGNMKTYEVYGKRYYVLESGKGFEQKGIASWYGTKFHGKKTSSGEPYDMYAMTAAHKTLPLPSYLEVKNLENGRRIIARVNDRGPFHDNRIVDLSYVAASKLGMMEKGTALVKIRAIDPVAPVTRRTGGAPVETRSRTSKKSKSLDFYIQVGVFSDLINAERLKDNLQQLETPVRIEEIKLHGRTAFRVKVGPLNNIEFADEIVSHLVQFDIHEHRILLE